MIDKELNLDEALMKIAQEASQKRLKLEDQIIKDLDEANRKYYEKISALEQESKEPATKELIYFFGMWFIGGLGAGLLVISLFSYVVANIVKYVWNH